MIDRGDIRQAIDRWQYLGFTGRALVMVSSSIRLDSLIANSKEAGGTVREIDEDRVTAIISASTFALSSARRGPLIITVINAITYKAQRDKNARELKLANAAITDMQMRQRDVAALDAKYTKELADAKAEK